jgi:hypothetical protein
VGYEWLSAGLDALRGIEPYEVQQVLRASRRWPRPGRDPVTGVEILTVWGRTRTGRGLLVAVRHLQGLDWQIIGARPLRSGEVEQLEKWEAGDE